MAKEVPSFLRLRDLEERGIASSFAGIRHMQIHHGFPLGRLLGPSTRVWSADEVNAWLATRPVEPSEMVRRRAQRSIDARNGRAANLLSGYNT